MDAHRIINPVQLSSVADVERLVAALPGWVYRGQSDSRWALSTTLERRHAELGHATPIDDLEAELLANFMATAPSRFDKLPDPDDWMGWFALMQHHGEPTRFLDFSESCQIAAYFALAGRKAGMQPAVWAVNKYILRKTVQSQIRFPNGYTLDYSDELIGGGLFNHLYRRATLAGFAAGVARPPRTDARIRAQQGLFVFPLNMDHSLEDNLYGMYSLSGAEARRHTTIGFWMGIDAPHILPKLQRSPVVKILLTDGCADECQAALDAAGIGRASLFPDEYTVDAAPAA